MDIESNIFDSNVKTFLTQWLAEVVRFMQGFVIPGTSLTLWTLALGLLGVGGVCLFFKLVFRVDTSSDGASRTFSWHSGDHRRYKL